MKIPFLSKWFGGAKRSGSRGPAGRISCPEDTEAWFERGHGLPYPCWPIIQDWILLRAGGEAGRSEASDAALRLWLGKMAGVLKSGYCVAESTHFLLLSPLQPVGRKWILAALENASHAIRRALGKMPGTDTPGKKVVIALYDDVYPLYVSHFYSEDYMGRTGGMMISRDGLRHIAVILPRAQSGEQQLLRTLAHELTHEALQPLSLPRWLDEALAMSFEDQLGGGEPSLEHRLGHQFEVIGSRALLREFFAWWTEERLQGFWSGQLWNSEDDEQSFCYEMSRLIFKVIRGQADRNHTGFRNFVRDADWDDGGAAAAEEHLGLCLGEAAASLLGEGDWKPDPDSWRSW